MIWNKSKQPADLQQGTAAAPKKGGAAAFAQKNWKWLGPGGIAVGGAGAGGHRGAGGRLVAAEAQERKAR